MQISFITYIICSLYLNTNCDIISEKYPIDLLRHLIKHKQLFSGFSYSVRHRELTTGRSGEEKPALKPCQNFTVSMKRNIH